jgi:hypothetical protein
MSTDKLLLLQEGLAHLEQASAHLARSHFVNSEILSPMNMRLTGCRKFISLWQYLRQSC